MSDPIRIDYDRIRMHTSLGEELHRKFRSMLIEQSMAVQERLEELVASGIMLSDIQLETRFESLNGNPNQVSLVTHFKVRETNTHNGKSKAERDQSQI